MKLVLYIFIGLLAIGIIGIVVYAGFIYFVFSGVNSNLGEPIDASRSNQFYYSKDKKEILYVLNGETKSALGASTLKLKPDQVRVIDTYFITDGSTLFIEDRDVTKEVLQPGDFKPLKGRYYTDGQQIYYFYRSLGIVYSQEDFQKTQIFAQHLVYQDRAYFQNSLITAVDSKTFVELANPNFAKDHNSVYYSGKKIPSAESSTARIVKPGLDFLLDNKHLFEKDRMIQLPSIEGMDVITLDSGVWLVTKKSVYFKGISYSLDYEGSDQPMIDSYLELLGADPESFKAIGHSYSVDKNSVYYAQYKLINLKPQDFKVANTDGRIAFLTDQEAEFFTTSQFRDEFNYINETAYQKRKNGDIYCLDEKLQDVDKPTFQTVNRDFAKDRNGYLYKGYRLIDTPMTDALAESIANDINFKFKRIFVKKTVKIIIEN